MTGLAGYLFFEVLTQILKDFALALLDFEENRRCHSRVVLPWVDFSSLEENPAQIGNALLRDEHLIVRLNHGSSSSTIPRFPKLRVVW